MHLLLLNILSGSSQVLSQGLLDWLRIVLLNDKLPETLGIVSHEMTDSSGWKPVFLSSGAYPMSWR